MIESSSYTSTYRVWTDPQERAEVHYDAMLDGLAQQFSPLTWFDPSSSLLNAQPVQEGGRAAAWFINIGGLSAVLRQYRRGGMAARFARDQYVWLGAGKTRAFAEFSLLLLMRAMGLPVPRPIAALVIRSGPIYRAALMTERIEHARPLSTFDEPQIWFEAGKVIAAMHHAGVWHADLNVYNILVDGQGKVWLIDFDRARRLKMHAGLRAENISRLLRSVRKVAASLESSCWAALNNGYQQAWQSLNPESK